MWNVNVYPVSEQNAMQFRELFDVCYGLWFGNRYLPPDVVSRVVKNARKFLAVRLVVHRQDDQHFLSCGVVHCPELYQNFLRKTLLRKKACKICAQWHCLKWRVVS